MLTALLLVFVPQRTSVAIARLTFRPPVKSHLTPYSVTTDQANIKTCPKSPSFECNCKSTVGDVKKTNVVIAAKDLDHNSPFSTNAK